MEHASDMPLSTCNMRGYGWKTWQGEKKLGQGQTEGKSLEQYSCDALTIICKCNVSGRGSTATSQVLDGSYAYLSR